VNATAYFGKPVIDYFSDVIIPRFIEIVTAPVQNPDMLWIVTPLVVAVVLMQFYFGRHPTEKLGWNTAFANAIALIFVSVNLLNHMYVTFGASVFSVEYASNNLKVLIALGIGAFGIVGMLLDFLHWLPEKVAFFLMSSIPINLTAYMAIVLVYSDAVPFDRITLLTALIFFFVLWFVFGLVKEMIPMTRTAKEELKEKEREKKSKKIEKKLQKKSKA
jgi:hypothetical protein